jgi:hypothetical protein
MRVGEFLFALFVVVGCSDPAPPADEAPLPPAALTAVALARPSSSDDAVRIPSGCPTSERASPRCDGRNTSDVA